jgi:hypothetical protein
MNGLTDKWFKNMDDGKLTGVLFIDLRKAFDTVNHTVLLHKRLSYGICHNTFKGFQSYLSNRKQYVSWRGALSKETDVSIGVPQGSILGPLFFILYKNDYPKCLKHSSITMYADDTSQDVSDKSVDVIESKLQEDFKLCAEWMLRNKLSINIQKTKCMLIGTTQWPLKSKKNRY